MRQKRTRSLALTLTISILAATVCVFVAILWYNYSVSRDMLKSRVDENARNLAVATANRMEKVLASVEQVPEAFAYYLEHSTYSEEDLLDITRAVITRNPGVFGSAVAFEPHAFASDREFFAPYCYRDKEGVVLKYLGGEDYNYFYWDWYLVPKILERPVWSEPYYDEGGGGIIMSTYSVPFYRSVGGERRFMGIVTADISLHWLEEIVSSVKLLETGYGFLISKNGTIITHPDAALPMNESIFSVAEARHDADLRKIGRRMVSGASGFEPTSGFTSDRQSWLAYLPLSTTGWSLGVLYPQNELLADIFHLNRVLGVLGLVGIALLSVIVITVAGTITRPLRVLATAAAEIATGNLDGFLPPIARRDEVGELANAFGHMRTSLKEHIRNLTEATAARERIESELSIAREIQMSLLPHGVRPFPEHDEFDIYATMRPAKEVGGDLYDFFLVDDTHLCVIVGDVSGKGVPAALFMALTKAMLKAVAGKDVGPHEMLFRTNNELCRDNDSCMFVTLFCAILDLGSGELRYANAGHNPALCKQPGRGACFLPSAPRTAAGVVENIEYTVSTCTLEPGAIVLLYTDGITESFNKDEEMFSEERLRREFSEADDGPPDQMARAVLDSVARFSADMPQADDVTLLVLRYCGNRGGT
jgi:phosphoserine phosphatase RsbU/P